MDCTDSLTQLYLNDVRDLMHALVDIGNQKQWKISKNEKSFSMVGGGTLPFESVWLSADTCADNQSFHSLVRNNDFPSDQVLQYVKRSGKIIL